MPYIKQEDRKELNSSIEEVVDALTDHGFKNVAAGELNYVLSSIIWKLWRQQISYTHGNMLMGVLSCVSQEFYRKQLSDYEDLKEKENGYI